MLAIGASDTMISTHRHNHQPFRAYALIEETDINHCDTGEKLQNQGQKKYVILPRQAWDAMGIMEGIAWKIIRS